MRLRLVKCSVIRLHRQQNDRGRVSEGGEAHLPPRCEVQVKCYRLMSLARQVFASQQVGCSAFTLLAPLPLGCTRLEALRHLIMRFFLFMLENNFPCDKYFNHLRLRQTSTALATSPTATTKVTSLTAIAT